MISGSGSCTDWSITYEYRFLFILGCEVSE